MKASELGVGAVFQEGIGEVRVLHAGSAIAEGSFVVASEGAAIDAQKLPAADSSGVSKLALKRGAADDGSGGSSAGTFGARERVVVVFEYRGAAPGSSYVVRWRFRGEDLPGVPTRVSAKPGVGRGVAWIAPGAGTPLPPGPYTVEILDGVSGGVVASGRFEVVAKRRGRPVDRRP